MGNRGGSSGGPKSNDYYASFAGVICYGPVDELVAVVVDEKVVWEPAQSVKRAAAANPYVFDITGWGRVHFYWGTATQVLSDPVLSPAGRGHPPYRLRAVAVFQDFLCGRERTSVPDISVVVRRWPKQAVITGAATNLNDAGQANPVVAVAEMLTDGVVGLGLPAAQLETASWQAAAAGMAVTAEDYLTVEAAENTRIRTMISGVNGYVDTWFRTNSAGQIEVGRFAASGTSGLPTLTRQDLASGGEPNYEVKMLCETDGRISLKFTNRLRGYQDDYAIFNNGSRRDQVGRENPAQIDRRWIRMPLQAARAAATIGARESRDGYKFTLALREDRADGLKPGDRLIWHDGVYEMLIVARILSRSGDSDIGGPVRLTLETEAVSADIVGTGASDFSDLDESVPLAIYPFNRVFQATEALLRANEEWRGSTRRYFSLVPRQQPQAIGYRTFFRKLTPQWQLVSRGSGWAYACVQINPITASGPTIDTTGNIRVRDLNAFQRPLAIDINTSPTDDEIADDQWLVIFTAFPITPLERRQYEITTLRLMIPDGLDFILHLTRARLGTAKQSLSGFCYFIRRDDLDFWTHSSLDTIAAGGTVAARTIEVTNVPFSLREEMAPTEDFINDSELV